MTQSFIAEVSVFHPDLPLTPTVRDVSDVSVRVESQPFGHPDSPSIFYSVSDANFGEFETALAADQTVDEWRLTEEFTDCRIYQVYPSSEAKFTVQKVADLGIRVLFIRSTDRGWQMGLQAPDKGTLGAYWQYCREENVQFDLEKLYSSGPRVTSSRADRFRSQLTDRQREVARTVTRMGYYERDGASAREVAAELGISPSTLSTHLRRIVAKLFHYMYDE